MGAEEWSFGKTEDPLTDEVITFAKKEGLEILCSNRSISKISIQFDNPPLFKVDTYSTTTYRFDKNKPNTEVFSTKFDDRKIVSPNPLKRSFFRNVFSSEKVFIRATNKDGGPSDKLIDLSGASEEEISNFADSCGTEVDISAEVLTAQSQFSIQMINVIEDLGPLTTQCLKYGYSLIGFVEDEDVNSKKDAKFYNSVASLLESYDTLCENRKKLKIKGFEHCEGVKSDNYRILIGGPIALKSDDKEKLNKMCPKERKKTTD